MFFTSNLFNFVQFDAERLRGVLRLFSDNLTIRFSRHLKLNLFHCLSFRLRQFKEEKNPRNYCHDTVRPKSSRLFKNKITCRIG
jgi:hypothetical protein